jgi:DNA-binding transcriptional LysR family regulator
MELRQLRYFVELANELHFGRAAAALHLSQPALSSSIAQLERELDVQLFARDRRSVALTLAGEAFYDDAARAVEAADRAAHAAKRAHSDTKRLLRVGFVDASTQWPMPEILAACTHEAPYVILQLRQAAGDELLEQVAGMKLDVAITRSVRHQPTLRFLPLRREPLVVIAPASCPLAELGSVSMSDLESVGLILPKRDLAREFYDAIIAACSTQGFRPRIAAQTTSVSVMLQLVGARVGVCIGTESMRNLYAGPIAFIPLKDVDLSTDIAVAWRHSDHRQEVLQFVDVCQGLATVGE